MLNTKEEEAMIEIKGSGPIVLLQKYSKWKCQ